jgi:uncharacterized protein (DUF952 family)
MIYRISGMDDWQRASSTGWFESADLAAEGFIHASEKSQILSTAHKHYRGQHGLVLLEIDDLALGALVVREDLAGSGMAFPHVYGPIPLAAIERHFAFDPGADGAFSLPAPLLP